MSKIAGRAAGFIDHIAEGCLGRIGEDGQRLAAEKGLMKGLIAAFLLAAVLLPFSLTAVFRAAVALPTGLALAVALFLVSVAAAMALLGLRAVRRPDIEPAEHAIPADLCPGLIMTLDPQGAVMGRAGRDRERFLPFLSEGRHGLFVESVHVLDRIAFVRQLDRLRRGADGARVELRLERPMIGRDRGQFLHVRMDMTARRTPSGELQHVVAQILDIEAEVDARSGAEQAARAADLANEAKSRFLAAVSHELRTPLNAILGFSDILAGEYFGRFENERQREYVGLIRQSGDHLLSVVNAMLDMSRIEAGRYELVLEPFEVARVVGDCENMLALQARNRGVVLASRVDRAAGEVVADERALRQILINLVGNAIKFTDAGGSVIIDATRDGALLKIVVSDTGIGIAPEKIAMLGRPFTQIHNDLTRHYEGSGLGLSLVKGLTALHGGRFVIESKPGQGTSVTVELPLDGSGAVIAGGDHDGAERENMVEFPPRLLDAARAGADRNPVLRDGAVDGAESQDVDDRGFYRERLLQEG